MSPIKKKKKILIIVASPRPRSNSSILAAETARGAEEAGAEVQTVRLADLVFGPCRACDRCRKPGAKGCVQDDDMKALHGAIGGADCLVIASPVYWFTMSGQAKLFMDRLYVFGARDYRELKGKRVGVILASGDADPRASGAVNAMRSFQDAFAYLGAPIAGMVHCGGGRAGAAARSKDLMAQAFDLGRSLAS
ncbi:MAG TPA: flavodoxin family protein [Candidatus Aminicenantes bacterium]|nr:flavodoxin family protein [Candidatus Aminicenantes bacterium]